MRDTTKGWIWLLLIVVGLCTISFVVAWHWQGKELNYLRDYKAMARVVVYEKNAEIARLNAWAAGLREKKAEWRVRLARISWAESRRPFVLTFRDLDGLYKTAVNEQEEIESRGRILRVDANRRGIDQDSPSERIVRKRRGRALWAR